MFKLLFSSFSSKKEEIDYYLDFYILKLLKNYFISKSTGFVNINELVNKSYLQELGVSKGYFRERVFYNVGIGYLRLMKPEDFSLKSIRKRFKRYNIPLKKVVRKDSKGNISIDSALYYKYILEVKITRQGLKRFEKLEKEMNMSNFRKYLKNLSNLGKEIFYTKKVLSSVGVFLIALLAVFIGPEYYEQLKKGNFSVSIIDIFSEEEQKAEKDSLTGIVEEEFFGEDDFGMFNIDSVEFYEISDQTTLIQIEYEHGFIQNFLVSFENGSYEVEQIDIEF